MPTELFNIEDVNPNMINWTVNIMVIEKAHPRTGNTSGKKYQKLVLIDSQGKKVSATIFGRDINTLEDTLELFKTYSISKAVVKPVPEEHQTLANKYQWILFGKTPIEEVQDENLTVRNLALDLMPLNRIHECLIQPRDINVLFAIAQVGSSRKIRQQDKESPVYDFTVIDQGLKPIQLTLWDQFVQAEGTAISKLPGPFPIVLGMHLRVSTFNGVSLATKSASTFSFNPPLPQANALQSWCFNNVDSIKEQCAGTAQQVRLPQSPPPAQIQIIDIRQVPTIVTQPKSYWIKASAKVLDFDQKFWYTCCPKCSRGTDAEPNEFFQCNHCKERIQSEPRCKVQAELKDTSGELIATIFGYQAEKLFSISAQNLLNNINKDGKVSRHALGTLNTVEKHILQLRIKPYETTGIPGCTFSVGSAYKQSDLQSSATVIIPASKDPKIPSSSKKARRELMFENSNVVEDEEFSEGSTNMMDYTLPSPRDQATHQKLD